MNLQIDRFRFYSILGCGIAMFVIIEVTTHLNSTMVRINFDKQELREAIVSTNQLQMLYWVNALCTDYRTLGSDPTCWIHL